MRPGCAEPGRRQPHRLAVRRELSGQWCAPGQAAIPTPRGGNEANRSSSLALGTLLARSVRAHRILVDFPSDGELMGLHTCHRGASVPYSAIARAPREEEVPFIR
jgi:hypothetical protein